MLSTRLRQATIGNLRTMAQDLQGLLRRVNDHCQGAGEGVQVRPCWLPLSLAVLMALFCFSPLHRQLTDAEEGAALPTLKATDAVNLAQIVRWPPSMLRRPCRRH